MMDFFAPLDLYCERVDSTFWAEPINAVSNLVFLAVAAIGLRDARRQRDVVACWLAGFVAVVGIGSFLFHTHANRWSFLADVVPIGLFVLAYLGLSLRRFCGLSPLFAVGGIAAFVVASVALLRALPSGFLNGGAPYLVTWAALFAVGVALMRARRPVGRGLLTALAVFTMAILFRTIDPTVCASFPAGTHFLWHIFDALTLYALLRTAVSYRPMAPKLAFGEAHG